MRLKNEDVVQALTGGGISLDRWVSLGDHLVGYFDDAGRLMARIIEDDALALAASDLLRERGQIHQVVADGNPI
ncbi:hypothetical protein WT67_29540 [Burkholderia stagnalis]|nr:hypothetical protein WT07_00205 [Burkholderia stagnalis]KVO47863.1 hypothetical protein WT17_05575 [Burkholderia stagnalis]KVO70026.1 hypothetical protein WT19_00895 [Burkholderia stagnalis]KVW59327.1 hypothetical protein WT28_23170 [Burkholderia stagnalis]KVW72417.1 hypothetical protein WT29_30250 [Burkholderia stagnalis]